MTGVERPERFDTTDPDRREDGLGAAALAVRRGELVLLPTDTVYGIGADAFDPEAVNRLLNAKGRGREMPPPVLISTVTTLDALATDVPEWARRLTDVFWPGPLTLVLRQQASLQWDLGDARETVALRMPEHDIALELIQRTGPLAVSSANTTGMPAALDAQEALAMLADEVTAVLDAGRVSGGTASTIIDCTNGEPRLLREGALAVTELRRVLADSGHPLGDLAGEDAGDLDDADEEAKPWPPTIVYENPDADDDVPAPDETAVRSIAAGRSAPRKTTARKASAAKKAPAKKSAAKKSAAKTSAAKKSTAKKSTAKKTAATSTTAQKATARTTAAKKAPAKTTAKTTAAKKAPAKQAPAKQAPAKQAAAKQTAAKRVPAEKAPAKRAPAKTIAKTTPAKGPDSGA